MEQLPIVRRRTRVWPIVLAIVVIALLVAAAFYVLGDRSVTNVTMEWLPGTAAAVGAASG